MGSAIDALGDTKTMLAHNTILWAGGGAITLVLGILYVFMMIIPIINLIAPVLILPVLGTGIIGLAYAARNGNASFDDFTASVSDNYVPYLLASLVMGVVFVVVGIVFTIIFAFVIGFGSMGVDAAGGEEEFFASIGLAMFLFPIAVFVVSFLIGLVIQFFDVAIVIDGAGPIDAFKRSLSLLRSEPLSVVGYTFMRSVLGAAVFGIPLVGVFLVIFGGSVAMTGSGGSESVGLIAMAGFAIWGLVVLPIGHVIMITYHVAFYNRHRAAGTI